MNFRRISLVATISLFLIVGWFSFSTLAELTGEDITRNTNHEDRFIIKYKKRNTSFLTNEKVLTNNIQSTNIESIETLNALGMSVVDLKDKTDREINEIKSRIQKDKNVEYIEVDEKLEMYYTGVITNDPQTINQWHLNSIGADSAWQMYNDGENKTLVAVNDTGIDTLHPDLSEMMKDLSGAGNCKDFDGSDYPGGCPNHGLNFEESTIKSYTDIYDTDGHGTHVAGIIGAKRNNNEGGAGVTENLEIMGAAMQNYSSLYNYFYLSDVVKSINFSIQNNAKVINASYGSTSYNQALYDSISEANTHGILFIAAAGNNGSNNELTHFYPSDYDLPNIISVASVGPNDTLATYSNYGNTSVDIAAPGGQIINFTTGEGGIISTVPFSASIMTDTLDLSDFTISGSGSSWMNYVTSNNGIHTNSYTGSYSSDIDSVLTMNQKFSLSGYEYAELSGYVSCDFGTGSYDSDFGDYLDFYIQYGTGSYDWIGWAYHDFVGDQNHYITLPITQETSLSSDVNLAINFVTDNDSDVGAGCTLYNFSVTGFDRDQHTYASYQGTSMAAPVVSGVAAMIWSYEPSMLYTEVKDILLSTVSPLGLGSQLVTGGKVHAQNALLEVMKRYGISKEGIFTGEIDVKKIHLDNKQIILSGSTITLTGTGNTFYVNGTGNVTGTGEIFMPQGTYAMSGTGVNLMGVSDDFSISFRDMSGSLLSQTGSSASGTSIMASYTGSIEGEDIFLEIQNIYNGPFSQNLIIPITQDISTTDLQYRLYTTNNSALGIGSDIILGLFYDTLYNFSFTYDAGNISIVSSKANVEVGEIFDITVEVEDILGNVITDYTGSIIFDNASDIHWNGQIISDTYTFSPSDNGVKTLSSLMFLTEGTKTIQASDTILSHLSGSSSTMTVVPSTLPTGNINAVDFTNSTTVNITLSASEYPVDFEVSGDIISSFTGTLSGETSFDVELNGGDGDKVINAFFTDLDLNVSPTVQKDITLDTISPVGTIIGSENETIPAKTHHFTLEITESHLNTGSILWSNNLNSVTGTGFSYTVENETSENLIVTTVFEDMAGNSGMVNSQTFIIDNSAPVISETTPVVVLGNDNTPDLSFSSTEIGTISYIGDCHSSQTGAIVGINTISFNSLTDGVHTNCDIHVNDTAGNISNTLSITDFTIDTTAPVLTLIGNSEIDIIQNETYTDSGAIAIDAIDGNISAHISSSGSVNTSTLGQYVVEYGIVDTAGNSSHTTRTVNVIARDESIDSISFTALTQQETNTVIQSNTVTITGINVPVEIHSTVLEYRKNSQAYSSATGTISNGDTLTVRITSSSENSTTSTGTIFVGSHEIPFSVTTKAKSSGGGGGGGGGGSSSKSASISSENLIVSDTSSNTEKNEIETTSTQTGDENILSETKNTEPTGTPNNSQQSSETVVSSANPSLIIDDLKPKIKIMHKIFARNFEVRSKVIESLSYLGEDFTKDVESIHQSYDTGIQIIDLLNEKVVSNSNIETTKEYKELISISTSISKIFTTQQIQIDGETVNYIEYKDPILKAIQTKIMALDKEPTKEEFIVAQQMLFYMNKAKNTEKGSAEYTYFKKKFQIAFKAFAPQVKKGKK